MEQHRSIAERVAGTESHLAKIAEEIDEFYDLLEFENAANEIDLNGQYILCLRILHARYSAALHLLKTGRNLTKEVKPL